MFNPSQLKPTQDNTVRSLFPKLNLKRRSLHNISSKTIRYSEEKKKTMASQPESSSSSTTTEPPAVSSKSTATARVIATPISSGEGQAKLNEHSYAAAAAPINDAPVNDTKDKESDTSSSESSDSSSNGSDEEIKPKSTAAEDVKASPRTRAQPKKYMDDYVTLGTPKGTTPSKRLTPKRASTSKGRTTKEPLRQTEEKRKSDVMYSIVGKKRGRGCGKCPGCLRDDCGTCAFCLDKPKFGGPGKKKQRCALRNCSNFMSTRTGTRKSPGGSGSKSSSSANTPSTSTPKATPSADKATSTKQTNKTPLTSKEVLNKVPPLVKGTPTSSTGATPTTPTPIAPKPVPLVSGLSKVTPQAQVLTTLDLQAFIAKATKLTPLPVSMATTSVSPLPMTTVSTTPATTSSGRSAPTNKNKPEGESSTAVGEKETPASGAAKMKCMQCGREKKMSLARTSNFCTQRCIIQWMDDHPDTSLSQAMGEELPTTLQTATTGSPKPTTTTPAADQKKPVSRALRNLQIDMAPPGTKLPPRSSDEGSSGDESDKPALKNGPTLRASKRAVATAQLSKTPPTAGTKRQSTSQQPASIKKVAKSPANGSATPKSVTFNLGATTPISSSEPTGGAMSIVPLDRLSGPLGNALLTSTKITTLTPPVSTAKGLPADIRSWTVNQVVHYFKSTPDCKEYSDMFQEQEVDGTALLLLSHENLVKCLGIKLGRAVKIMAHVEELKLQFEKQAS